MNKKIVVAVLTAFSLVSACFLSCTCTPVASTFTTHSDIYDMPVYPDDTAPKVLSANNLAIEWLPFISATCEDENGSIVMFYLSISHYSSGSSATCKILVDGTVYGMSADMSKFTYEDGMLTVGTMPKIVFNYRLPHEVSCFFTPTQKLVFTVAFRGTPLWYSKQVNKMDMLSTNQDLAIGGYDALSEIKGVWHNGGDGDGREAATEFAGYGVCEHVWLIGEESQFYTTHMVWMVFNDENSYGVVSESKNTSTGELLAKTGRIWSNGQTYMFDDFVWKDDGEVGHQAPKVIGISGNARDLFGKEVRVDLHTIPEESFNPFVWDVWMFHRVVGSIGGTAFDGHSHCEVRRVFPYPIYREENSWITRPPISPTPSPSPSPTPTAFPSATPTPKQEPTSTPKPQQYEPFPTSLVIAASGASVVVIGVGVLVYFRKRKR